MAVADTREGRGTKRSQTESSVQAKSKKIGRPSHGGSQCSHPGCLNKAQTKGKCRTHTRNGKCSYSGCDKQAQFKGLCAGHGGKRVCSHPGCDKKVASKGKCGDHGGGRPSSYQKRRKSTRPRGKGSQQEDTTFSLLAATAAVMPPVSFADSRGSMVSLLLGESSRAVGNTAIIATSEGSAQQETSGDIVSEVVV
ncbi:hypothetical protein F441_07167 [Phytophthora nicotianae CJ01A1]|uniref:Uncharacterized protein n=5 Tax=Phytophthora nicotianae TaxID=4792 RepID=W2QBT8_PHYN3|nr:hypothetical protein PPTG_09760 [Phytophthora nicotianae INRA-310]ETI48872.1 hypothetical protein F443_07150 [Phytophthora nicotianae P1569]ETK88747.1 hypothetical protein L915_07038 [Phytophthora nicotianae]ETO77583.1 hypothetical protein F444_07221 [Phytophthora nicotianae P1976]ETP18630.1 hypothetical protein F441_07167 [Phytophthora nicotianae CJ01A1]ETL42136.1 hypothetical protein L916_06994 [Phytophthora nicotianae]